MPLVDIIKRNRNLLLMLSYMAIVFPSLCVHEHLGIMKMPGYNNKALAFTQLMFQLLGYLYGGKRQLGTREGTFFMCFISEYSNHFSISRNLDLICALLRASSHILALEKIFDIS